MDRKEIITICGGLGSGKSSTAKKVAEKLGYQHFSSGDFFRQVGLDLGLTVTELSIKAEKDPQIDVMTDEKLRGLRDSSKLVIDSRTAYHWIPESFKVYLSLSPEIAKDRIVEDLKQNTLRQSSEHISSPEEAYAQMTARFESEQKRYWDLYKIDNTDPKNFDLIVDTNINNLDEVVNIIISEYKNWLRKY